MALPANDTVDISLARAGEQSVFAFNGTVMAQHLSNVMKKMRYSPVMENRWNRYTAILHSIEGIGSLIQR